MDRVCIFIDGSNFYHAGKTPWRTALFQLLAGDARAMMFDDKVSWASRIFSWLRHALSLVRTVRTLDTRVRNLEDRLTSLKANAPPKPQDLRLRNGIQWGTYPDDTQVHAFCRNCVADGKYVPLLRSDRYANNTRRDDGFVSYKCDTCDSYHELSLAEETEARKRDE